MIKQKKKGGMKKRERWKKPESFLGQNNPKRGTNDSRVSDDDVAIMAEIAQLFVGETQRALEQMDFIVVALHDGLVGNTWICFKLEARSIHQFAEISHELEDEAIVCNLRC